MTDRTASPIMGEQFFSTFQALAAQINLAYDTEALANAIEDSLNHGITDFESVLTFAYGAATFDNRNAEAAFERFCQLLDEK